MSSATERLEALETAVAKGADIDNGTLWLCLIDRIDPLNREAVETMMSQYDRESPQTLYDLAQTTGLKVDNASKDWVLREVYPDYRETADPAAQAIKDIYGLCSSLFIWRDLKSTPQENEPFGYHVAERFFMRSITRDLELVEITRKLHAAVVHPAVVRAEHAEVPVRIFAATHPGWRPSIALSAV